MDKPVLEAAVRQQIDAFGGESTGANVHYNDVLNGPTMGRVTTMLDQAIVTPDDDGRRRLMQAARRELLRPQMEAAAVEALIAETEASMGLSD
jgi:hypothetical protein